MICKYYNAIVMWVVAGASQVQVLLFGTFWNFSF